MNETCYAMCLLADIGSLPDASLQAAIFSSHAADLSRLTDWAEPSSLLEGMMTSRSSDNNDNT